MILTWTPEFIDTALSTLTEQQRAAIHLTTDLGATAKSGPVRLKRFGFSSIGEYSTAVETVRARLEIGSRFGAFTNSVIWICQPGRRAEARIQKKAGIKKKS